MMKNAIGAQSGKYNSRDRDSRNKKNGGTTSFNANAGYSDPMQAVQHQYANKTSNDLQDQSRNNLNASLEYK